MRRDRSPGRTDTDSSIRASVTSGSSPYATLLDAWLEVSGHADLPADLAGPAASALHRAMVHVLAVTMNHDLGQADDVLAEVAEARAALRTSNSPDAGQVADLLSTAVARVEAWRHSLLVR